MTFTFLGIKYSIEFSRTYKEIWKKEIEDGSFVKALSSFPYTTCRIIIHPIEDEKTVRAGRIVYRTATVGCWHKEKKGFTLEQGRRHSLRALCAGKSLSPDFKRAIWDCYLKRVKMVPPTSLPPVLPDMAAILQATNVDVGNDVPGGGAI